MTFAWFDKGNGRQVYRRIHEGPGPARSGLPCPMVAGDTMEATQHPCDGKFYTSKARFRAETRAHGCVEMGNDPARLRQAPRVQSNKTEIRASLEKARARLSA